MSDWIDLSRAVVHPWHHDHFGHMNVRHYAPFFDDATYHLWTRIGLPYSEMLRDYGIHTVSASATTSFIKELVAGDLVRIDGAVVRVGGRSASFQLRMHHADRGDLHATYDLVEVFFDPKTRGSTAIPDAMRAKLDAHLVTAD
ncbi:MAG: thioesterase family protein [Pseudomonadota bacterium]